MGLTREEELTDFFKDGLNIAGSASASKFLVVSILLVAR